jgi:hypothetical protein
MDDSSLREERRSGYDRRQVARVTRCGQCHAHLVADRRGNTVRLFAAAAYRPLGMQESWPSGHVEPRCPICQAPLRPSTGDAA